jgi:ABC-2 type transport system permease protein
MMMLLISLWRRRRATRASAPPTPVIRAGRRTSAAARGPLALLVHEFRYSLIASMRNPRARFFTFIFPVLLLVIFAGLFGNGHTVVDGARVSLSRYYVAGILALSIVTAAYASLVVTITTTRQTGILKRRRATPVPAWALIGGQALSTLLVAAIMTALLLVVAQAFYGVGLSLAALVSIVLTVIIGTLSFACIAYAVAGLIGSPDAAQPVVQATILPLYFISGVWIPTAHLPHALQRIGSIFPIEHLASSAHLATVHSSLAAAISAKDLALLAAWGVGAAIFAARRFTWLPRVATA